MKKNARRLKEKALFYTDKFSVYYEIIPWAQHSAVGKESGKTSYIERFNCTIRQRCSRLVRLLQHNTEGRLEQKCWGSGKHVSADGTKWNVYEQDVLSEYHIRYGGYGEIGYCQRWE